MNQKIDAPPHIKRCGLNGARFIKNRRFLNVSKMPIFEHPEIQVNFYASQRRALLSLDARSVPQPKGCGFSQHFDMINL